MIRTAITVVYLALLVLLWWLPLMVYAVLTGSGDFLYHGSLAGVLVIYRVIGIRSRAEGVENIPAGPCLFAANHTSNIDPPAIMKCIPRRVAILAKKSLFAIPIVGPAFRVGRFVPVDRSNAEEAMASLELAAKYMKEGTSFLIYPEGTRSPDGRLLRFKSGAFALAIKTGVPVVPVACVGAQRIMPKNSLRITPGEVVVRFCPPIDAKAYRMEDRGKLAEQVRAAIAAALPPDQRPAR
jgi:1-acyl-sn-glycerol-3-phosphate acyltransferase